MFAILAQAQQPNAIVSFLPLLLIGVVFYFLLIRPQNQRRRAQMEMQSSIEVGDDIVSTAGRLADAALTPGERRPRLRIVYVIDLPLTVPLTSKPTKQGIEDANGIVTVEVAPGVEIRLARAAVATRLADDDEFDDEVEGAEPGS